MSVYGLYIFENWLLTNETSCDIMSTTARGNPNRNTVNAHRHQTQLDGLNLPNCIPHEPRTGCKGRRPAPGRGKHWKSKATKRKLVLDKFEKLWYNPIIRTTERTERRKRQRKRTTRDGCTESAEKQLEEKSA